VPPEEPEEIPIPWDHYETQSDDQIIANITKLRIEARDNLDKIEQVKAYEHAHTQRPFILHTADDTKNNIVDWTSKWTSKWEGHA
jgi:hypothetical protein